MPEGAEGRECFVQRKEKVQDGQHKSRPLPSLSSETRSGQEPQPHVTQPVSVKHSEFPVNWWSLNGIGIWQRFIVWRIGFGYNLYSPSFAKVCIIFRKPVS